MMHETRVEIASRIFQKIWRDGEYGWGADTFTEDCVHHFFDRIHIARIPGPRGYLWIVESFRKALTDLEVTFEIEPSGAVVHWSVSGLGVRPLFDVALPPHRVQLAGNDFYSFSGKKIAETWSVWNVEGCLKRVAAG